MGKQGGKMHLRLHFEIQADSSVQVTLNTTSRAQWLWLLTSMWKVENCTIVGITTKHQSSIEVKHKVQRPKSSYCPRVLPILMAVSCLSPVRIQILMSAFIRVSMVSGTLSWSLSSIAVAPSSCKFYTRNEEKTEKKLYEKKVSKWWSQQRKAFKTSSVRKTCVPGLCHCFFPSSVALVYHPEKPPQA